jgi:predicted nucleotidyltransferase
MASEFALADALSAALKASPVCSEVDVAILFGSAARGRLLHAESDVDIGIVPVSPAMTLHQELELQAELQRVCGRQVDLVRLDGSDTLLRWEVARSGRVLLERSSGAAARFRAQAALEHADIGPLIEAGAERWRHAVLAGKGALR